MGPETPRGAPEAAQPASRRPRPGGSRGLRPGTGSSCRRLRHARALVRVRGEAVRLLLPNRVSRASLGTLRLRPGAQPRGSRDYEAGTWLGAVTG